jgi:exopolysaccharide production protein ExoZ
MYRLSNGWIGAALIGLGVAIFINVNPTEGSERVVRFGIPTGLLLVGALFLEDCFRRRFNSRALIYLGNASYSIYIWHSFAISITLRGIALLNLPSMLGVPIAIGMACLVGTVGYRFLELPLLSFVRGSYLGSPKAHDRATANSPVA